MCCYIRIAVNFTFLGTVFTIVIRLWCRRCPHFSEFIRLPCIRAARISICQAGPLRDYKFSLVLIIRFIKFSFLGIRREEIVEIVSTVCVCLCQKGIFKLSVLVNM